MCNLYVYMFDHGVTVISLFFRPNSIYREELSLWRKRFLKKCWLKSQKRPVRRDGQDTGTSWFNPKLGFSKRVQKMAMGARPCPSRTGWIPSGPAGACVVILCSQHENRVHLLEMMSSAAAWKRPLCVISGSSTPMQWSERLASRYPTARHYHLSTSCDMDSAREVIWAEKRTFFCSGYWHNTN